MTEISRHFANIDGRWVHYRRCGQAPALVLLHASPVSSRVFLPAMLLWGRHFTCFAFDTPGNGLSTPLTTDVPTIADYVDAQAGILELLGIAMNTLESTDVPSVLHRGLAAPFTISCRALPMTARSRKCRPNRDSRAICL